MNSKNSAKNVKSWCGKCKELGSVKCKREHYIFLIIFHVYLREYFKTYIVKRNKYVDISTRPYVIFMKKSR